MVHHRSHKKEESKTLLNGSKKVKAKHHKENHSYQELLIGGLAGGVIGAAIAYLLASKRAHKFGENLLETYEEFNEKAHDFADDVSKKGKFFARKTQSNANKWLEIAKEFIDGLADNAHDRSEVLVDKAKELVNHRRVHDVMDWAALGVKIWQELTKK